MSERLSQQVAEALRSGSTSTQERLSQQVVETLRGGSLTTRLRLTQQVIEVLYPSGAPPAGDKGFGFDYKDTLGNLHSVFVPETTAVGDLIVRGSAENKVLPGNASTTTRVLAQTGTGAASAVPVWTDPASLGVAGGTAGGDLTGTYPNPQTTGWTGSIP